MALSESRVLVSFRAMTGSFSTTAMLPEPSRAGAGVRVGAVAAAATVGAVIGLGLRHGLALRPFTSAGVALFDRLGLPIMRGAAATVAGVTLVTTAIIVLGVCFTFVAAPLRGLRLFLSAMMFAAIGWGASLYVARSILVLSDETVLGSAQRVFIFAMLAIALVAGMRLARPNVRVE